MLQTHVPWHQSIVFRLAVIYSVLPLIVLVVAAIQLRKQQEIEVQDRFGLALQAIAGSTAPFIAAEDLGTINDNSDSNSRAFQNARMVLESAQIQNGLAEDQVYILRPTEDPEVFRFVVMLQQPTFIGDDYRPPESVRETYEYVSREKKTARTNLFTDDHGMFISGIAPVFDEHGETVALVQADYGVEMYIDEVETRFRKIIGAIFAILFFLGCVGFYLRGYVRRRIVSLMAATNAISEERYDHTVKVHGRDELAMVGTALGRSLSQLKERFEMLKFLPRHTALMIAASADKGVSLNEGRRAKVTVLESDIRGFTKLSESRDPQEIIDMLNVYVCAQAELVTQYDGSVDKFMGDAMLAVFEGEDAEKNAFRCAIDIQDRIAELNEQPQFGTPIQIGIGISSGEVVMGNMGSESRMEHTVIGSTVNLAARLCSAADAGQIVAMRHFSQFAQDETIGTDQVDVKGFSEPIEIVRFQP